MKNIIRKTSIESLGYNFIPQQYLPKDENEYVYRNIQNRSGIPYRKLTALEIESLVRNNNTSDDWNNILVSDFFNAALVKNCKFYGLVRIAKLEPYFLGFSDLKVPVGLYNSTIISCDFGDNVSIDNVNYLSHCILGNEVIVHNVNELLTTNHAKFGIGIVKQGEDENVRIWLELCNENGGRRVMPFNNMQPGDAYLWSKYRDDNELLEKFKQFTESEFKNNRGYYGKIGDRTVIKNCRIIKDVWIGEDAYIKGANKLKNLTINSGEEGRTQIGEGVELVNGIIGYGCTIFYGCKAVRFIMAPHSQLKYGARLINSYLGHNATISCCEVLNTLIFPAHEQHHNNSFLCAALIMGQSNIAAGATIGSNHNSRGADGEIIAGRGFWPGLCVSLKHNSQFASFTIIAKGDYENELNISIPFALVSNNVAKNQLTIMPGYWFMYNMYALARNSWKYVDRDKRIEKIQHIEYEFLAPDTINEMFITLTILEEAVGKAFFIAQNSTESKIKESSITKGKTLLNDKDAIINTLEIVVEGFENNKRKTIINKALEAYHLYKELIGYYGITQLIQFIEQEKIPSLQELKKQIPKQIERQQWQNIGGQLLPTKDVELLKEKIKTNKIKNWDAVHEFYTKEGTHYPTKKLQHALASLQEINGINLQKLSPIELHKLIESAYQTKQWITNNIYTSRAKDYSNPYRKMVYDTQGEMDSVMGKLEDNSFINSQKAELIKFKKTITAIKKVMV